MPKKRCEEGRKILGGGLAWVVRRLLPLSVGPETVRPPCNAAVCYCGR